MSDSQPSRVLLIVAGALTQLTGLACLVLGLASLPIVHDLHSGTQSVIATVVAALAAIVCGTLVYRGRLVPLALATGLDIGFGIVLPRGGSALGALLHVLPADDAATAETLVTAGAIAMFAAAIMCAIAIPSAIQLRRWARDELARGERPAKPADTLKGLGPTRLVPTQIIHTPTARGKPVVVIGVAVTLIAIGIVVITAASGDKPSEAEPHPVALPAPAPAPRPPPPRPVITVDAGPPDAPAQSALAFVASFHDAIAHGAVGPLLDAKVFGFGPEAHDVVEGRDAVAKLVAKGAVEVRFQQLGGDGELAWLAEELRVGGKTYVVTAALGGHAGTWSIAALQWAIAMPNETAYRLAREANLAIPDAIPDRHDTSPLADAMRTAFASKPSFVDARSTRGDAFNFGSASGERIAGGEAIKKTFARIRATIRLHDAVQVGTIGDRGGWGAANVEFTDADRDGTDVTQTFRVLAVWVREDVGWRIVQTQWSNAR